MRKLHFDYDMHIEYSKPVSICYFTIKCIPGTTQRQRLCNMSIELFPKVSYSNGTDSFGNASIYGCVDEEHREFCFHITGDVETGLTEYEEELDEDMEAIFRHSYQLNQPGEQLKAYYERIKEQLPKDTYQMALYLMHRLYEEFTYEKNCTSVNTTAEEAWAQGKGVCQDYAHIMIALLHMEGVCARYVVGMLIGEGASHAWVEVLYRGKWYGFDPTNDSIVTDAHIRLGVGRDASDCLINRGVMRGGGNQTQTIAVSVQELIE